MNTRAVSTRPRPEAEDGRRSTRPRRETDPALPDVRDPDALPSVPDADIIAALTWVQLPTTGSAHDRMMRLLHTVQLPDDQLASGKFRHTTLTRAQLLRALQIRSLPTAGGLEEQRRRLATSIRQRPEGPSAREATQQPESEQRNIFNSTHGPPEDQQVYTEETLHPTELFPPRRGVPQVLMRDTLIQAGIVPADDPGLLDKQYKEYLETEENSPSPPHDSYDFDTLEQLHEYAHAAGIQAHTMPRETLIQTLREALAITSHVPPASLFQVNTARSAFRPTVQAESPPQHIATDDPQQLLAQVADLQQKLHRTQRQLRQWQTRASSASRPPTEAPAEGDPRSQYESGQLQHADQDDPNDPPRAETPRPPMLTQRSARGFASRVPTATTQRTRLDTATLQQLDPRTLTNPSANARPLVPAQHRHLRPPQPQHPRPAPPTDPQIAALHAQVQQLAAMVQRNTAPPPAQDALAKGIADGMAAAMHPLIAVLRESNSDTTAMSVRKVADTASHEVTPIYKDDVLTFGSQIRQMCSWIREPAQGLDERLQLTVLDAQRRTVSHQIQNDLTFNEGLDQFTKYVDEQLRDAGSFEVRYYKQDTAALRAQQQRTFHDSWARLKLQLKTALAALGGDESMYRSMLRLVMRRALHTDVPDVTLKFMQSHQKLLDWFGGQAAAGTAPTRAPLPQTLLLGAPPFTAPPVAGFLMPPPALPPVPIFPPTARQPPADRQLQGGAQPPLNRVLGAHMVSSMQVAGANSFYMRQKGAGRSARTCRTPGCPAPLGHEAWECPIAFARAHPGKTMPGWTSNGEKEPTSWDGDNLTEHGRKQWANAITAGYFKLHPFPQQGGPPPDPCKPRAQGQ